MTAILPDATKNALRRPLVFGAIVAVLLAGGVAYASIPDANGVIHGCRKNSTGDLRVIDSASQNCAGNETALDWSQTGPQGPAGPTGAQGPAGLSGYQLATDATSIPQGGPSLFWSATVLCSSGKKILGGGGSLQLSADNTLVLVQSAAAFSGDQEGWSVTYRRLATIESATQISVNAICATVAV